jgi:hypothetical protein
MAVRSRCSQCKWAEKNRSVRKISVLLTESAKISDIQNQPLAVALGRRGARGFANAAGAPYGL